MRLASAIILGASFALLSACVALQEFGANSCRTVYVFSGGIIQPVNSCGGVPREGLRTGLAVASGNDLAALLAAPKFEPDAFYAGVETPGRLPPLMRVVQGAIGNLIAMPEPRDAELARQHLARAVEALDRFATADREQAYRYLVLAWRTAGFVSESGLLPVSDEDVLTVP